MIKRWLLLGAVLGPICVTGVALAQLGVTSSNLSGTITTTNTFQSLQVPTTSRKGCTIQNNGTHTMYVYFGPVANATTGAALALSAGQPAFCAVGLGGVGVLTDQISITGTSGDAYFANFQ
jgi:hypothetical protein